MRITEADIQNGNFRFDSRPYRNMILGVYAYQYLMYRKLPLLDDIASSMSERVTHRREGEEREELRREFERMLHDTAASNWPRMGIVHLAVVLEQIWVVVFNKNRGNMKAAMSPESVPWFQEVLDLRNLIAHCDGVLNETFVNDSRREIITSMDYEIMGAKERGEPSFNAHKRLIMDSETGLIYVQRVYYMLEELSTNCDWARLERGEN